MKCKTMGLPRLVQMHKKYSKDGFEVVSVSLDKPDEKDTRRR